MREGEGREDVGDDEKKQFYCGMIGSCCKEKKSGRRNSVFSLCKVQGPCRKK